MENPSTSPLVDGPRLGHRMRFGARAMGLCWILLAIPGACVAQTQNVLCSDGSGSFQAGFRSTGIAVRVGASRNGELAIRKCDAILSWSKKSLPVATAASQVDLDVFGADLGLGVPIAAFQVKQLDTDCCLEYQMFSLEAPPKLLRTITGGDFFMAADTDLDGRVEVWTDDAAAMHDFENLQAELDYAPTIVLRFERGRLLDVSAEFEPYFDGEIAKARSELDKSDLRAFEGSDGKLSTNDVLSADRRHDLRKAKAKVLEIVWGYLYSGREQQAWRALVEMWPAKDVARIRAAILYRRAQGIAAQVDGVSADLSNKRKKRARVFDSTTDSGTKPEVSPPEPINITLPAVSGGVLHSLSTSDATLELVIDSAGKVRSAEPVGKSVAFAPALVQASAGWKFIPALKEGRAVACRTRLSVSVEQ